MSVLHTGQTGVERGADRAARVVGFAVEGCCTYERRDELSALPPQIVADLRACTERGARAALRATLEGADALVIAVPDRARANHYVGIEALRRTCRAVGAPHWIVDPTSDLEELALELRQAEAKHGRLRLMVSGPRMTRWPDGERIGWRVVAQLSLSPCLIDACRHRVLVIDDHCETAQTTCRLIRSLGHDAEPAITGREGLALAARLDLDVGLFDLGLPDITGYEVARQLRASVAHPVFLAAITGWAKAQDPADAFAAGFDRHVIKPTNAEMIRGLLAEATQRLA